MAYVLGAMWLSAFTIIGIINTSLVMILNQTLKVETTIMLQYACTACMTLIYKKITTLLTDKKYQKDKQYQEYEIKQWQFAFAGFLLLIAAFTHLQGIKMTSMPYNSVMMLSIPFFVTILSGVILKENISSSIIQVTLGLIGVIIAMLPNLITMKVDSSFKIGTLLLVISVLAYSLLDVLIKYTLNKKIEQTNTFFYVSAYASIFASIFILIKSLWKYMMYNQLPAVYYLTNTHIFLIFVVGIGNVCALLCVFKAYENIEISKIQPFKYIELPISYFIGKYFFGNISFPVFWPGLAIMFFASIYNAYTEMQISDNHKKIDI